MKVKDFHTMLLQWIDNSMFEDPADCDVDIEFALHNIKELYDEIESGGADISISFEHIAHRLLLTRKDYK